MHRGGGPQNGDNYMFDSNTGSKRQRFYNLVKNTKEVYIPNISQKTINTIKNTTNYYMENVGNQPLTEDNIPLQLPPNIKIDYFPTYVIKKDDGYETVLRFCVCAPYDEKSKKYKIIYSLWKQYLKPSAVIDDDLMEKNLNEAIQDSPMNTLSRNSSSFHTLSGSNTGLESISTASTQSSTGRNEVEVLHDRISGFVAKKISGLQTVIELIDFNNEENTKSVYQTTDNSGNVMLRVSTKFLPTDVKITLDLPTNYGDSISMKYPLQYIEPDGIGLISDIDDTVKHTGVTGDKKSIMRNVFLQSLDTWLIDGVPLWYNTLKDSSQVNFFYVSNSPSQIYFLLKDYISEHLPPGPLFLKQYSGNFLSSIMTSSANRKSESIEQIMEDFPDKRFFLVGDSGEKDFEAYTNTALKYPDRILGIYIRCCKDSMTDLGIRDADAMNELNDIISKTFSKPSQLEEKALKLRRPPPPITGKKPELTKDQNEMIESSRSANSNLTINNLKPPPLPQRKSVTNHNLNADMGLNNYFDDTSSPYQDRKFETWKLRVTDGISKLKINGNDKFGMRIAFFSDPSLTLEDSMNMIRNYNKNLHLK